MTNICFHIHRFPAKLQFVNSKQQQPLWNRDSENIFNAYYLAFPSVPLREHSKNRNKLIYPYLRSTTAHNEFISRTLPAERKETDDEDARFVPIVKPSVAPLFIS